jgi:hypothetical protein
MRYTRAKGEARQRGKKELTRTDDKILKVYLDTISLHMSDRI